MGARRPTNHEVTRRTRYAAPSHREAMVDPQPPPQGWLNPNWIGPAWPLAAQRHSGNQTPAALEITAPAGEFPIWRASYSNIVT